MFSPNSYIFDQVHSINNGSMSFGSSDPGALCFHFYYLNTTKSEWQELTEDCIRFAEIVSGLKCRNNGSGYGVISTIRIVPVKSIWNIKD